MASRIDVPSADILAFPRIDIPSLFASQTFEEIGNDCIGIRTPKVIVGFRTILFRTDLLLSRIDVPTTTTVMSTITSR